MLVKIKYLTAGESHGKGLLGIIDGVPAGLEINEEFIAHDLFRRQQGHGRGGRMKIENDHAIELKGSFFIGDALSDIELATNYGLEALLVRTGHGKQTEKNIQTGSLVFENLLDAVQEFILIE